MAGTVIRAFDKRMFDFSNLTSTTDYVIVKTLDIAKWTSVEVWVRVHSSDIVPDDAEIHVVAQPTGPSAEDPATDFLDIGTSAAVVVDKNTPAPGLVGLDISSISGGFLRLSIKGVPGDPVDTTAAELSVDLICKSK